MNETKMYFTWAFIAATVVVALVLAYVLLHYFAWLLVLAAAGLGGLNAYKYSDEAFAFASRHFSRFMTKK